MYKIPKYTNGVMKKGNPILLELARGTIWGDRSGKILVIRDETTQNSDHRLLNSFRVQELVGDRIPHVWAIGLDFEGAIELACRLVVGIDYIPTTLRQQPENISHFEFEVGDVLPGDFHLHRYNGIVCGFDYELDENSRMEIDIVFWLAAHKKSPSPNKSGVITSMSEEDIPEKIMVVYSYDDRYFSAILRRSKGKPARPPL